MLYSQKIFNIPDISSKELVDYRNIVTDEIVKIGEEVNNGDLHLLSVAFETDDLKFIKAKADEIRSKFKKVILIGIGGSSLGAKTLGILSENQKYVTFMDSLDTETVQKVINETNLEETLVISVSKSGKTIEALCQTTIFINLMQKADIDIKSHCLFVTENKENPLTKIAKKFDVEIMIHPSDIGGRYSYLSLVGLLPAAIMGLDIEKIRKGARDVLKYVIDNKDNCEVTNAIVAQLYLFDRGVVSNVMMHYVDKFEYLIEWYRQLLAESIGKNGFGITPIASVGTKDQHSQLQLYLGGPRDKFYSFFGMEEYQKDIKFDTSFIDGFASNIDGKYLGDILQIEQDSTVQCLVNEKLPVRTIKFKEFSEESLSSIMVQMFLETIIICRVKGINPFDQPAVELRKKIAREMLLK